MRQAVARVIPSQTASEERTIERTDELVAQRRALRGEGGGLTGASAAAGGGGAALARAASEIGARERELHMVEQELNMLRVLRRIDRDYKGYDIAQGLMTVVRSLSLSRPQDHRLFSDGLPVSPVLSARLDIADRRRQPRQRDHLRGRYQRPAREEHRERYPQGARRLSEERRAQNATGEYRTDSRLTMSIERVEDMLLLDSRAGLARLSENTGGFLVEGSNNLSAGFRRIDEDNQFHYLLTYSPKNAAFDGKFRAIRVKVARPGVQVFARKGYRAVASPASALDRQLRRRRRCRCSTATPLPERLPDPRCRLQLPDSADRD